MNHSENEILISAYLDDELTADERARVEQLLATSTEARQLLDELRALRGTLQSLPQHRLEIDFAQSVLRQAEREFTATQTPTNIPHSPLPTPHSDSPLNSSPLTLPQARPRLVSRRHRRRRINHNHDQTFRAKPPTSTACRATRRPRSCKFWPRNNRPLKNLLPSRAS